VFTRHHDCDDYESLAFLSLIHSSRSSLMAQFQRSERLERVTVVYLSVFVCVYMCSVCVCVCSVCVCSVCVCV
jgi:hypothetical protein